MSYFPLFWLFVFGISVGSFLNVLIDRLPQNKSFFKGRSHCDVCKHTLFWYDLIPLVSFILLKRKCRYCGAFISWQYPIVELISGLLFVFAYHFAYSVYFYPSSSATMIYIIGAEIGAEIFNLTLIYSLIIISGLIVVFFTDLKYRIIPDKIIITLATTSLLFLSLFPQSVSIIHYPISISHQSLFINHLLSALAIFFIFFLLATITHGRGMGLGDVKFSLLMGLVLGYPRVVVAFYLSFLTGAFFSLILILLGKKTMKSTIPFGPFLVTSTLISLFYGFNIWKLSLKILGI